MTLDKKVKLEIELKRAKRWFWVNFGCAVGNIGFYMNTQRLLSLGVAGACLLLAFYWYSEEKKCVKKKDKK
jgi:hypothetical protein